MWNRRMNKKGKVKLIKQNLKVICRLIFGK